MATRNKGFGFRFYDQGTKNYSSIVYFPLVGLQLGPLERLLLNISQLSLFVLLCGNCRNLVPVTMFVNEFQDEELALDDCLLRKIQVVSIGLLFIKSYQ